MPDPILVPVSLDDFGLELSVCDLVSLPVIGLKPELSRCLAGETEDADGIFGKNPDLVVLACFAREVRLTIL